MTDYRHPDPSVPISFVLLNEDDPEPAAVSAVLLAEMPDATVNLDPDTGIVTVEFDEATVFVSTISAPVPAEEVAQAVSNNVSWSDGASVVAGQKSHLLVAAMSKNDGDSNAENGAGKGGSDSCGCGGCTCGAGDEGEDARWDALARQLRLCEVVAALAGMESVLGIYLGTQAVVYAPDFYREVLAEAIDEEALPIPLLVYLLCGPVEAGGSAAFTVGFPALGHADLEFASASDDVEELYHLMFNVVHYLLSTGSELQPGETLGYSEDQKLEISVGKGSYTDDEVIHVTV